MVLCSASFCVHYVVSNDLYDLRAIYVAFCLTSLLIFGFELHHAHRHRHPSRLIDGNDEDYGLLYRKTTATPTHPMTRTSSLRLTHHLTTIITTTIITMPRSIRSNAR